MDASPHRPFAVVTGASSGIGLELARQFQANGFDLIVEAEDDAIHAVAADLGAEPVQVDLAVPEGVEAALRPHRRHRPSGRRARAQRRHRSRRRVR
jgi:NAD(P)-dependent dehydrogenase (short-subunit alcohol dehydrogenase family)